MREIVKVTVSHTAPSVPLSNSEEADGYSSDDSLQDLKWLPDIKRTDVLMAPVSKTSNKRKYADLPPNVSIPDQDKLKRPPFSYLQLSCMALASSADLTLSLVNIYKWIETHFPYFLQKSYFQDWRCSIRHVLINYDFIQRCRVREVNGKLLVGYRLDITDQERLHLVRLILEYTSHLNSQYISKWTQELIFKTQKKRYIPMRSHDRTGSCETLNSTISSCSSQDSGVSSCPSSVASPRNIMGSTGSLKSSSFLPNGDLQLVFNDNTTMGSVMSQQHTQMPLLLSSPRPTVLQTNTSFNYLILPFNNRSFSQPTGPCHILSNLEVLSNVRPSFCEPTTSSSARQHARRRPTRQCQPLRTLHESLSQTSTLPYGSLSTPVLSPPGLVELPMGMSAHSPFETASPSCSSMEFSAATPKSGPSPDSSIDFLTASPMSVDSTLNPEFDLESLGMYGLFNPAEDSGTDIFSTPLKPAGNTSDLSLADPPMDCSFDHLNLDNFAALDDL